MTQSTPFWFQDPPSFFSSLVPGAFILWVGVASGSGTLTRRYAPERFPAAALTATEAANPEQAPLALLQLENRIGFELPW